MKDPQKGFLVLEILIAGLILTAGVASTMYLFRVGYEHLERANRSNLFSSKLLQAWGLLKTMEPDGKSGVLDMGNGVTMEWTAQLLGSSSPMKGAGEFSEMSMYELLLYRYDFSLIYQNERRDFQINVFRYKPFALPGKTVSP